MSDWMKPEEVAELTGYTTGSLKTLRSNRKVFPFYKAGNKVLYRRSEIEAVLGENRIDVRPRR